MKVTIVSPIGGKLFVYAGHLTANQVKATAVKLSAEYYGHFAYCACTKCDRNETATFYVNFGVEKNPPLNVDGTVERASQVAEMYFTHSETLEPVEEPVGDPVILLQWDDAADTCDVITMTRPTSTSPARPLVLPQNCTDTELIDFLRVQFDSGCWSVREILRSPTTAQVIWSNQGVIDRKSVTSVIWE